VGQFSLMHWIVVGVVALVLFGRGRISETMGDFGKGISSFKRGLADDEQQARSSSPVAHALPQPNPDRTIETPAGERTGEQP